MHSSEKKFGFTSLNTKSSSLIFFNESATAGIINIYYILRRVIEGSTVFNLSLVLVFVDFKKAFDSITRSKTLQILCSYGIPEKIVIALDYFTTTLRVPL